MIYDESLWIIDYLYQQYYCCRFLEHGRLGSCAM